MTGYGKGVSVREKRTVTVELKAVNNRFLEINARLPKYLMAGEDIVRKEIGAVLKRGTVDVFFDYKNEGSDKTLLVDYELAGLYRNAAVELSDKFGVPNTMTSSELLKLYDVVSISSETDTQLLLEMLVEATKQAVRSLDEMRIKEGEAARCDFESLVSNIEAHLSAVKLRVPNVVSDFRIKLKKRIEEYLGEVELDEARLLNEVAFFADKADINEEIIRLSSHIDQFRTLLGSSGETGRRLDFLSQEMNREINTMGSKSNDLEIAAHVVAMKNELEKIKEQVRNVE